MDNIKEFNAKSAFPYALGFIGCGNMAYAIVSGLIKAKLFEETSIIVSGTKMESFERWTHFNVAKTLKNKEVVEKSQITFLCVKPNVANAIANSMGKDVTTSPNQTFVSILAGKSLEDIKDIFKNLQHLNFIRAMPNTPLMVCAGATALTADDVRSESSLRNFEVIKSIFKTLGIVEIVDENKFHAITGLSGSGPAYIYIMIEALSDAGVKQGLPRDLATKFAAQTVFGASKTLLETGLHPGQAKDQVTSAGGTTIYGLHELEKGRIRDSLINAVEAATKRSEEMSKYVAPMNIFISK
ncbi:CLUMA_CG008120, isoform A [Clunio marinus]|uniref:pyrroline-5-carboxylate reductase n=1 Tax=Clunio marinus TaxID=568069 RepID=A0A1J1I4U9_9DIPT|nr:CLUMA_CG008120, isoform A [Clunio marinus]